MKMCAFASRNTKEILRDRLNVIFGLGFPLIVLLLLTLIQSNVPQELFPLRKLTPGIAVFGLSFVSLFSATVISKDRSSSLMLRLYSSPMRPADYILGYTLPLLPMSIAQSLICFAAALALGLEWSVNILLSIAVLVPAMLLFIAVGLICGTLLNDKQVGGICGALLTNLSGWLSGVWFDLALVGGAFEKAARVFPFVHAADAAREAIAGNYAAIPEHLTVVLLYAVILFILAAVIFRKKMKI